VGRELELGTLKEHERRAPVQGFNTRILRGKLTAKGIVEEVLNVAANVR
jgi:hypothetical protein